MQEFIKSSLDYIEQNLKTEITVDDLAVVANYSVGHFCRLFAQTMDSTVASYILKRRLDHALAEIWLGKKAIDVVLEYGFDTYAGFYKAFVKMYGCSPKKYLLYKKQEVFIMHSEKDIRAVLTNWDIPQGLKIENVSTRHWKTRDIEWHIWKVGDEHYLKTKERSVMVRNIKIAKALKKEGLDSEFLPVPTKAGNDFLGSEHVFMLTKKVGEPVIDRPLPDEELASMEFNDDRRKHAYKLGQTIAKIHRALQTVQDDVQPWEANLYKQGLHSMPKVKDYLQKYGLEIVDAFFDDYVKTFGELYDKMPKQLSHGNPTGDTVAYENGEIVGIKGYEIYNMSRVRLFDVIWCAGETNTQPIDSYLAMFKDILKGYDSVNPLTCEEKQAIYYMLCVAAMNCIAHIDDDTFDVLKRNLRALVFLAENKQMFFNLV